MKKEYDLKKMKSRKNPYGNRLKKQITIRLDNNTIEYFKQLARETGLSYQTLINLRSLEFSGSSPVYKHKKDNGLSLEVVGDAGFEPAASTVCKRLYGPIDEQGQPYWFEVLTCH
jgi:hypothetical protein